MFDRPALRIGAVNYLNSKPLVEGLATLAPHAAVQFDLPSRLADRLAHDELDVALVPSVELFRRSDYFALSDACIACRGPVLSVKLFCRKPVADIATVALDEGSRTSVALTRIMLAERFGLQPRLEPLPIGSSLADTNADAVLLIGDRAIHSPPGPFAEVWDLGDQWLRWTGLPFVFAAWVGRHGRDLGGVAELLSNVRDAALANLEAIAAREAAPAGLTVPQCLAYFRDHLHFHFGDMERRGLTLFHQKAAAAGLAPPGWKLDWRRPQHPVPQKTQSRTVSPASFNSASR